jgi:hypothetical protein
VFQVDPDHLTARGGSDASGELSDEAHPYYGDALTEVKVALPEAVQSYRPERRKRRIDDWDAVWDRDTEIGWHGKHLRMRRLFAAAGDDVPRPNIANTRPDPLNTSGGAIPEWRERFETVPNGRDGRTDPVGPDLVDDLTNLVWSAPSLSEEAVSSDLDLRSLRAGADEGGLGSHEDLPVIELRSGNVQHAELPVFHPLRQLLHVVPSSVCVSTLPATRTTG